MPLALVAMVALAGCPGGREQPLALDASAPVTADSAGAPSFDSGGSGGGDGSIDSAPGASCTRFNAPQPGETRGIAVGADGTLYITGPSGDGYFVAALDSCGNTLRSQQRVPDGTSKGGSDGLVLVNDTLLIAGIATASGASESRGLLTTLSAATLAPVATQLVIGGGAGDEVNALAFDAASVWAFGTRRGGGATSPWIVRAPSSLQGGCNAALFDGGFGNALTISGAEVYLAGSTGTRAFVARRPLAGCDAANCSSCGPTWRSETGASSALQADARAVLVVGNTVYVGGYEREGGDRARAIVWSFDATSGAERASWSWDPDPATGEAVLALASDGTTLYVVGGRGWTAAGFQTTRGSVHALALPDLSERWSADPGDVGFYQAVRVDGNRLLVGGGLGATGVLRACDLGGQC